METSFNRPHLLFSDFSPLASYTSTSFLFLFFNIYDRSCGKPETGNLRFQNSSFLLPFAFVFFISNDTIIIRILDKKKGNLMLETYNFQVSIQVLVVRTFGCWPILANGLFFLFFNYVHKNTNIQRVCMFATRWFKVRPWSEIRSTRVWLDEPANHPK